MVEVINCSLGSWLREDNMRKALGSIKEVNIGAEELLPEMQIIGFFDKGDLDGREYIPGRTLEDFYGL